MRLYPRIKTELSASIIGAKLGTMAATITDLGIDGAFLRGHFRSVSENSIEDSIALKYNLPIYGSFEHSGKVIRKSNDSIAVSFYNLAVTTKTKLWEYISDNLVDLNECPYCGEKYEIIPAVCKVCGWRLEFDSPGYFEYNEKMSLLKKLHSKIETMAPDQIQRMINFVDTDILKIGTSEEFQEFVGTSDVMLEVFSNIRKVAPTDIPVLILGESGTGKELTARAIHERSIRRDGVFVAINCAAIPENLLEAELFGYERGAFTGAYTSKKGKFEHADGGTIFLDEIGEFPLSLQAKLLRFLEDKIVERVGATVGKKVNVRLIAATNCDIKSAVASGKFRGDLYYRLNAFIINLPPVRERGEDSVVLARYFLERFSREAGMSKTFTVDAINAIRNYSWTGNVREIINKVRKAIIIASDNSIRPQDLDIDVQEAPNESYLRGAREKFEKQKVKEVLGICGNNISKAAKMLGISRPSLYSLKKKYGI